MIFWHFSCYRCFLDSIDWLNFFLFHHSRRISGQVAGLFGCLGASDRGIVQNVHIDFITLPFFCSIIFLLSILEVHEFIDNPIDGYLFGVVDLWCCSVCEDVPTSRGFVIRRLHKYYCHNKIINTQIGGTDWLDPAKGNSGIFIKIVVVPILYRIIFQK